MFQRKITPTAQAIVRLRAPFMRPAMSAESSAEHSSGVFALPS